MTEASTDSITHWIRQLGTAKDDAAAQLWGTYESRLLSLAAAHLSKAVRRVSDPEDVVASVFESFFERAAQGALPPDANRDDLWRLLSKIVQYKAASHARREMRLKRGGGRRVDAVSPDGERDWLAESPSPDLSPDVAVEVAETVDGMLSILDDQQREIIRLKLEGYLDREIAERLGVSVPTIERRLRLIRSQWKDWSEKHVER